MRSGSQRLILSLSGAIPAIGIAAGLLVLEPASVVRQQYWPWLPLLVLVLGLGFSALFWLVLVPRRQGNDRG